MKTFALILALTISVNSYTQYQQDIKFAVTNTVTSGVITGVGAMVNKKKTDKRTYGKIFVNAFWKGCVGGAVCQSSKYIAQRIAVDDNLLWGWPTNLVSSLGSSIMENTQLGNKMFSSYNISLYWLNLEVGKSGFKPRLDVMSVAGSGYMLFNKYDFNIKNSLYLGGLYWDITCDKNYKELGLNIFNNIAITKNKYLQKINIKGYNDKFKFKNISNNMTVSHEINHSIQYNSLTIHTYSNKSINVKLSIYPIFYYIYNNLNGYSSNFFEVESRYLSNPKNIDRVSYEENKYGYIEN